MSTRLIKIILIVVAVIAVGVGAYYGRYFITKKVVEEALPQTMQQSSESLRQGTFTEIDFAHKGSGRALILQDTQGNGLVRLEDFRVTNGPDLYVYLSPNSQPGKDKASLGEFVSLGRLKGNIGNQNYEIPQNVQIEDYQSVVIWCEQFGVLFSFASLQ